MTEPESNAEQLWPMGAVTRRTGIGEHTLRAWERRFGFPMPVRLPSGHRRYPLDQVRRLLMITTALGCGYRAGDVVPLEVDRLEALLRECGALDRSEPAPSTGWVSTMLDYGRRFDRDAAAASLQQEATVLGLPAFLRERIVPLIGEIGEAWSRGDLEVAHEHFLSNVLEDSLRSLRVPLEASAQGRPVVLAGLEGEVHGIGLQMVALAVTASGRRTMFLGQQTPAEEVLRTAATADAAAVGLSVSVFSAGPESLEAITALRNELPDQIRLWLGGAGVPLLGELPDGVQHVAHLDDLDRELLSLPLR